MSIICALKRNKWSLSKWSIAAFIPIDIHVIVKRVLIQVNLVTLISQCIPPPTNYIGDWKLDDG
jgi:hypothetical protein